MYRIPGILYHTLKGSNGWNKCDLSKVDVARIVGVEYRERLFCLFDQDKPYTLHLTYYLPKTESTVAPVYSGGWGVAHVNETTLEQVITKRYRSEDQVKEEMEAIEKVEDGESGLDCP